MRNRFLLIFALMLFLCAIPVSAYDKTVVTNSTEYIFVGDSYSRRPFSDPELTWPAQLQKKLSLSDNQVCFVQQSGYGFSKTDRQFGTLLSALDSSKKVKKILIVGGVTNDYRKSYKKIHKDFLSVDSLLEKKYPNAKVYYAAPSWKLNASFHNKIQKHKKWYRLFSQEAGWYYLDGPQNVLVNHPERFEDDGHHPNVNGVNAIVKKLYASFIKDEYKIKFDKNGGTGKMQKIVCKNGTKIILPKNAFKKKEYVFSGWKGSNGKTYKNGETVKNLGSKNGEIITLKAVWKKKK